MRTSIEPVPGPAPGGPGSHLRYRRALGRLTAGSGAALLALTVSGGPAFAAQKQVQTKNDVEVELVSVGGYGKVLVDQAGLALYHDTPLATPVMPPSVCTCPSSCLADWSPLVLRKGQSEPIAGTGVVGLGVLTISSGRQVTWDGEPLYTYALDSVGTVLGQGLVQDGMSIAQDGTWYVAQPVA